MDPGFRVFQTRPEPANEITNQLVDGQPLYIYDETEGTVLFRNGNELIATFFKSGIALIATVNPYYFEYYINFRIQVPQSYSGRAQGMLGNLDGDPTNDFYRRGEANPLPNTISERDLFQEFKTCK